MMQPLPHPETRPTATTKMPTNLRGSVAQRLEGEQERAGVDGCRDCRGHRGLGSLWGDALSRSLGAKPGEAEVCKPWHRGACEGLLEMKLVRRIRKRGAQSLLELQHLGGWRSNQGTEEQPETRGHRRELGAGAQAKERGEEVSGSLGKPEGPLASTAEVDKGEAWEAALELKTGRRPLGLDLGLGNYMGRELPGTRGSWAGGPHRTGRSRPAHCSTP